MKTPLNREELVRQLKELAAKGNDFPHGRHYGAMCYEPGPEDNISSFCRHCLRPLHYYAYRSEEEEIMQIVKEINDLGYDATLEVVCGSCVMKAKDEAEFFNLPFDCDCDIFPEGGYHLFSFKAKSDIDYHQAVSDSLFDYQAVLAFLKGEPYFMDSYECDYTIEEVQEDIKRMTGIEMKNLLAF